MKWDGLLVRASSKALNVSGCFFFVAFFLLFPREAGHLPMRSTQHSCLLLS